ncbi:MAG: hypothetical protein HY319_19955, partial [Armatimonadetes bacterium]|nr:hypothetical protein [Armatimonadota bacterium]
AQHGRVFGSHAGAFVTQEGGKTWTPEEAPGDVNAYSRRDGLACLTLNAPGYWRRQGILCFRADDLKRGVFREKTRTGRIFHGQDAQVVGPETAWVTTDTAIFRTTDGGKDWTAVEVGETRRGSTVVNGIVSSYFLDQDRGWLALEDGTLTVTRDGGQRREAVSAAGLEGWRVVRLHFLDQERGVALASSLSVDDAALLVTQDGGRSWQVKQQLGDHGWSELFVLDEAHAWVAGADRGVVVLAATPF